MADSEPLKIENEAQLLEALGNDNPVELCRVATEEQLRRVKSAQDLLDSRHEARRRRSRAAGLAQLLVGYVALAGFFANAYQSWSNQKQAEERAQKESERWTKEFKRAQDSDKYRAFFETSALVTDAANPDRRLVGYALLKEFVDDKDYSTKAIFMLEESLALELRGSSDGREMDEEHHLAIVAILSALSHTSDCKALAVAARSVDKLVQKRNRRPPGSAVQAAPPPPSDVEIESTAELFSLFVRRLVGRAAEVCSTAKEFREVRRPIRDALLHLPVQSGERDKNGKPLLRSSADANRRIAEILRASCQDETQTPSLSSDCTEVDKGYTRLCDEMLKLPDHAEEDGGCRAMTPTTPL